MLSRFHSGLAVNTVRGYRTAIAALHSGFQDGSTLSSSSDLNLLISGMFISRPQVRTLVPPWSLTLVMEQLLKHPFEPMRSCSLKFLTLKTVFLVALCSGRRRGALAALSLQPQYFRVENAGIRLSTFASFLAKNQRLDFLPQSIFLKNMSSFSSEHEDHLWCPLRALNYYIKRTKEHRQDQDIFLTHIAPFRKASSSSIARWLVKVIAFRLLSLAGPGTPLPHAHQIRSLAASWTLLWSSYS